MAYEKLLVVKLGGGEGLYLDAACADLASLAARRPLIIVHGVSAIMNNLCAELGVEVQGFDLALRAQFPLHTAPPCVIFTCAPRKWQMPNGSMLYDSAASRHLDSSVKTWRSAGSASKRFARS